MTINENHHVTLIGYRSIEANPEGYHPGRNVPICMSTTLLWKKMLSNSEVWTCFPNSLRTWTLKEMFCCQWSFIYIIYRCLQIKLNLNIFSKNLPILGQFIKISKSRPILEIGNQFAYLCKIGPFPKRLLVTIGLTNNGNNRVGLYLQIKLNWFLVKASD